MLECRCAQHVRLDDRATVGIKLDGTLCSPILLDGVLRWATRSQLSGPIEAFATAHSGGSRFTELCTKWLQEGWTPLFEWCEATRTPGVVQHSRDSLTLIAVRHMIRGNYLGPDELAATAAAYQVPAAEQISVRQIIGAASMPDQSGHPMSFEQSTAAMEALQDAVRGWEGAEGGVLLTTTPAGAQQMYKMKSSWWLSMAAASKQAGSPFLLSLVKLRPSLAHVPPEALWSVALHDKRDDLLPPCVQLLQHAGERRRVLQLELLALLDPPHLKTDLTWLRLIPPYVGRREDAERLSSFCQGVDARFEELVEFLGRWAAATGAQATRAIATPNVHTRDARPYLSALFLSLFLLRLFPRSCS